MPQGFDVQLIPIDLIKPNPNQPRPALSASEVEDLVASIAELGLLHPISVTPHPNPEDRSKGYYMLVQGERRYRACRQLGWETIPATVIPLESSLGTMLAENADRVEVKGHERTAAVLRFLTQVTGLSLYQVVYFSANLGNWSRAAKEKAEKIEKKEGRSPKDTELFTPGEIEFIDAVWKLTRYSGYRSRGKASYKTSLEKIDRVLKFANDVIELRSRLVCSSWGFLPLYVLYRHRLTGEGINALIVLAKLRGVEDILQRMGSEGEGWFPGSREILRRAEEFLTKAVLPEDLEEVEKARAQERSKVPDFTPDYTSFPSAPDPEIPTEELEPKLRELAGEFFRRAEEAGIYLPLEAVLRFTPKELLLGVERERRRKRKGEQGDLDLPFPDGLGLTEAIRSLEEVSRLSREFAAYLRKKVVRGLREFYPDLLERLSKGELSPEAAREELRQKAPHLEAALSLLLHYARLLQVGAATLGYLEHVDNPQKYPSARSWVGSLPVPPWAFRQIPEVRYALLALLSDYGGEGKPTLGRFFHTSELHIVAGERVEDGLKHRYLWNTKSLPWREPVARLEKEKGTGDLIPFSRAAVGEKEEVRLPQEVLEAHFKGEKPYDYRQVLMERLARKDGYDHLFVAEGNLDRQREFHAVLNLEAPEVSLEELGLGSPWPVRSRVELGLYWLNREYDLRRANIPKVIRESMRDFRRNLPVLDLHRALHALEPYSPKLRELLDRDRKLRAEMNRLDVPHEEREAKREEWRSWFPTMLQELEPVALEALKVWYAENLKRYLAFLKEAGVQGVEVIFRDLPVPRKGAEQGNGAPVEQREGAASPQGEEQEKAPQEEAASEGQGIQAVREERSAPGGEERAASPEGEGQGASGEESKGARRGWPHPDIPW